MAPGQKRKRGDRSYSGDGADGYSRPSPHRPQDLELAQNSQQYSPRQEYGRGYSTHRGQSTYNQSYSQNSNYNYHQNPGHYQTSGRGRGRGNRDNRGGFYSHRGNITSPDPIGRASVGQHSQTPVADSPDAQNSLEPTIPTISQPLPNTSKNVQPAENAHASIAASTAQQPLLSLQPGEPKLPFEYRFFTDDRLSRWQSGGRKELVAMGIDAVGADDNHKTSILFEEILFAGWETKIDAADAGQMVKEIVESTAGDTVDVASLFIDSLSIFSEAETPNEQLTALVAATGIPPTLMRETLEQPTLNALGLVRSSFAKMFIRHQTQALYRQSNYNLIREESEGYSKLVTELFKTTENNPPSQAVVAETFENVKALIGAFDLDAGRVLDIILDVCATTLVKHFRFFTKFFRTSAFWPQDSPTCEKTRKFGHLPLWAHPNHDHWSCSDEEKKAVAVLKQERDAEFWSRAREVGMDAFFELGGRRILSEEEASKFLNEKIADGDPRAAETQRWVKQTRTKPPSGNYVAAQLLGFKLRFYASPSRDNEDALPVNLIYLAAHLIKIGFISLRDLYPHVYPYDDLMGTAKEKAMKEKEEKEASKRPGNATNNALARAGALSDDTLPAPPPVTVSRIKDQEARSHTPSRTDPNSASRAASPSVKGEEEEKESPPEPTDQKVQLLKSLLCIGALPEALFVLGRFPWMTDVYSDIPEYLSRIVHHQISKVYEALRPLPLRSGIRSAAIPTSQKRWALLDKNDVEGVDYKFYFDEWIDNVPVCQNVDDLFTLFNTFMNLFGVKIGQDPSLLTKLARIGKQSYVDDDSNSNRQRWVDICKRLLCPALSLTGSNSGVVNEVFELVKLFSIETRFSIYAEWFTGQISRLPDINEAFQTTRAATNDIMKRISKENTRPMARALAKVACSSPGIVYQVALAQIEKWNNLIDVFVECARYLTYMGYDILTWTLINSLGRAGRDRVSQNQVSVSLWLASLSTFAGKVFKRYSVMNVAPLLQYVLEQLRLDNFIDLRLLREITFTMAGIAADTNLNESQIQAMAGGELLQMQTLKQVEDKRNETKGTAKRLIRSLTESGIAGPLLVAIAQQREKCIFNESQSSLKVIGDNFDEINVVFAQFLDMLQSNLPTKDFDSLVPGLGSLITDFGIDPSIAFAIHRKSISRAMGEHDRFVADKKVAKFEDHLADNGETEAMDTSTTEAESQALDTAGSIDNDADQKETDDPSSSQKIRVLPMPELKGAGSWHPVLENTMEELKYRLRNKFEEEMSLSFYVTFWQLSLHDIHAPENCYSAEGKRLDASIARINADRSDASAAGAKRKEHDKKSINDLKARLTEEMKSHINTRVSVRERLSKEKNKWFLGFSTPRQVQTLNANILQDCFIPRMLMSPMEAYFAQKMLFFLHWSGPIGFRTMHIIDRLMSENLLVNLIFQCTEKEGQNLGRFLHDLLKELNAWHGSQPVYDRRALGPKKELPGFARSLDKEGKPETFLGYEDFRRLLFKWHRQLCEAIAMCLNSGEYRHIKNAIVILEKVSREFPVVNYQGKKLSNIANGLADREKRNGREDLAVAARSLLGALKQRESKWLMPQAFYVNDAIAKSANVPNRQASTGYKASPKSQEGSANKLSPGAILPTSEQPSEPNTAPNASTLKRTEFEDGEVRDAEGTSTRTLSSNPRQNATTKADLEAMKARAMASTAHRRESQNVEIEGPKFSITQAGSDAKFSKLEQAEPPSLTAITASTLTSNPINSSVASTARHDGHHPASTSSTPMPSRHQLPNRPEVRPPMQGRIPDAPDVPPGYSPSDNQRRNNPTSIKRERLSDLVQERSGSKQGVSPTSRTPVNEPTLKGFPPSSDRPQRGQYEDQQRTPQQRDYGYESSASRGPHHSRQDFTDSIRRVQPGFHTGHPVQASAQPQLDPGRAALIQQDDGSQSRSLDRRTEYAQETRERNKTSFEYQSSSSQHPSSTRADSYRDERDMSTRAAVSDSRYASAGYSHEQTPSGPRPNRASRSDFYHQDHYSRSDSMHPPPGPARGFSDRNNRSQEPLRPSAHQDPNYGRLNADNNMQTSSSQVPRSDTRAATGTSHAERKFGSNAPNSNNASSRDVTRTESSTGPGRWSTHAETAYSSSPLAPSNETGVHPSRLKQIDSQNGPHVPQTGINSHRSNPSNPLSSAPNGPRSSVLTQQQGNMVPSQPSPTATDRPPAEGHNDRRRGDVRRFQDLQGTLQQSQSQDKPRPAQRYDQPRANVGNTSSRSEDRGDDRGTSIRGRAAAQAAAATHRQPEASNGLSQALQTRDTDASSAGLDATAHDYGHRGAHPSFITRERDRERSRSPRGGRHTERSHREDRGRDTRDQDSRYSSHRSSREHSRADDHRLPNRSGGPRENKDTRDYLGERERGPITNVSHDKEDLMSARLRGSNVERSRERVDRLPPQDGDRERRGREPVLPSKSTQDPNPRHRDDVGRKHVWAGEQYDEEPTTRNRDEGRRGGTRVLSDTKRPRRGGR